MRYIWLESDGRAVRQSDGITDVVKPTIAVINHRISRNMQSLSPT